ncbi:carbon-nitrogen hydrolase family protein [Saccharopolyspora spinosa]|uniref:Aliphatic amidase n=1 Tax=Saccharopolyspora spinosa TaxID=60894 RepID=Q6JHR5_SACSN|nr:carbon-nitrogen hydrolase family protein [Saccharopolyspora spinosa]AAS00392.1 aliphatic amidase [Saccharopolyspora spinosa NRRL 18395]
MSSTDSTGMPGLGPTSLTAPRVGLVQSGSVLGDVAANIDTAVNEVISAAERGADLLVFPECYLHGYMFADADAVHQAALPLDDPALLPLHHVVRRTGVHAVLGLLERGTDGYVYNTALALGPAGTLGHYRKQHIPFMGADRFVAPGDDGAPRVFDTPFGRVGMMICFDLRFPESARELALAGADIIVMPTAWPASATLLAELVTRVRAWENRVFLAIADRPDEEGGLRFLGRSQIVGPDADIVLDAGAETGTFVAEVQLERARAKELVFIPGEYEVSIFGARRPGRYAAITDPSLPAPPSRVGSWRSE